MKVIVSNISVSIVVLLLTILILVLLLVGDIVIVVARIIVGDIRFIFPFISVFSVSSKVNAAVLVLILALIPRI